MRIHPSSFRQSSFYWQMPLGMLLLFVAVAWSFYTKEVTLVAARDIGSGEVLKPIFFEPKSLPRTGGFDGVSTFNDLKGCYSTGPIPKGFPVSKELFSGQCAALSGAG